MNCLISSYTKTDTYTDIISITFPTHKGTVQVKTGHAEYLTRLVEGELVCVSEKNKKIRIPVSKGVCHVKDDVITIIV